MLWKSDQRTPQSVDHQKPLLEHFPNLIPLSSSLLASHNVKIAGNGDQYVVLSHGFGSVQSVWKHVLPKLVNNYKVILYDLMGAGSTDPEDFNFSRYSSRHAYSDDLLAILDELEIESCLFVGASMTGMIGYLDSIERPEVFKKLILLASSPRYFNDVILLRRIRPARLGPGLRRHEVQLQVMGDWIRTIVSGSGPPEQSSATMPTIENFPLVLQWKIELSTF